MYNITIKKVLIDVDASKLKYWKTVNISNTLRAVLLVILSMILGCYLYV